MQDIIVVFPFVESSELIPAAREIYRHVSDVEFVGIVEGKDPMVKYSDVEFQKAGILNRIVSAEKEGYRAAIIGCFGDPGLIAARELASIPVLGPGESSLAVASSLGDRILILEPERALIYLDWQT